MSIIVITGGKGTHIVQGTTSIRILHTIYYDGPFSRPDTNQKSDQESCRSSSNQDQFCREDLSVKVKSFNPKETDWFT